MPLKSLAQTRLAYASLKNKTSMPKDVAQEMIDATPKSRFKKLKEKLSKKKSA